MAHDPCSLDTGLNILLQTSGFSLCHNCMFSINVPFFSAELHKESFQKMVGLHLYQAVG